MPEQGEIADRERVLLVLANLHDDAAHIATMLVRELVLDGVVVESAALDGHAIPPIADYDAVALGAHVRFGLHTRSVVEYIRTHILELRGAPCFFFSVGRRSTAKCDGEMRRLAQRTGWHPTLAWAFTDAIDVRRDDVRAFARLIAEDIPAVGQRTMAT